MGQIQYSEKYFDDTFEYRHVVLPPEVAKLLPKNRLLSRGVIRSISTSFTISAASLSSAPLTVSAALDVTVAA
ncbi:hypothetical protein L6452_43126 [Arctium lappa]|uniref:Uncharacterized protein n=1 Tax=Arctium lappa TaxID=4217 RepID=A0ACB8XKD9_ARCLA|nr:hypothetical protein L6452_43126 [Arctium lappa]